MSVAQTIRIVEVGPRDGLQNESTIIPTQIKIDFIKQLISAGIKDIETASFVSPKWVLQMADSNEIMQSLSNNNSANFIALVPNLKGLEGALAAGVKEIAIFGAASETFSQKNINCSIAESLQRFKQVASVATQNNLKIRGYLSCVLGCPYEGEVSPAKVVELTEEMLAMGCYEISLGDTIGVGTVDKTKALLNTVLKKIPVKNIAVHFHDTYGQALVNIYAALQYGIETIDSSAGGLGGCPYAPGSSGNVATEDVVYMLNGLGINTSINLNELCKAIKFIHEHLKKMPRSKVYQAVMSKNI